MELNEERRQQIACLLLTKLPEAREALRRDADEHDGIESGSGLLRGELTQFLGRIEKGETIGQRDAENALALLIYTSATGGGTPATFSGQQAATSCGIPTEELQAFNSGFKAVQFGEQLARYRVRDLLGKNIYLIVDANRWSELGLSDAARLKQPTVGNSSLARATVNAIHGTSLQVTLFGNPADAFNGVTLQVDANDLLTRGGGGYYWTDQDHGVVTGFE